MKRFIPLVLIFAAGCGVSSRLPETGDGPHPAIKPESAVQVQVVVIGDSIVDAWSANGGSAAQPGWVWLGSSSTGATEETSAQVAARFPAALAYHPKAIVIEAGSWDVDLTPYPNADSVCDDPGAPCTNLTAMINGALNAGTHVVLCTVPPWGSGSQADQLDPINPDDNIDELNQWILHYAGGSPGIQPTDPPLAPYPQGLTVLDMHAYLAVDGEDGQSDDFADSDGDIYVAGYSDDGINPNTAGATVMTMVAATAVQAVIE